MNCSKCKHFTMYHSRLNGSSGICSAGKYVLEASSIYNYGKCNFQDKGDSKTENIVELPGYKNVTDHETISYYK